MKVPKREVIKFVVKSVLHKRFATSQEELTSRVNKELKKVDPEYSVTGKRLREVIVSMPEIKVSASLKKGKIRSSCPVCGHSLKSVWTRNLKGRKVVDGLRCQKCGFKGRSGKCSPARYIFRMA